MFASGQELMNPRSSMALMKSTRNDSIASVENFRNSSLESSRTNSLESSRNFSGFSLASPRESDLRSQRVSSFTSPRESDLSVRQIGSTESIATSNPQRSSSGNLDRGLIHVNSNRSASLDSKMTNIHADSKISSSQPEIKRVVSEGANELFKHLEIFPQPDTTGDFAGQPPPTPPPPTPPMEAESNWSNANRIKG